MTAPTTVAPEVAQRVAAGAAYLDEQMPGWWLLIDLNRLDIARPCRCILGQLFGDYYDAPISVDDAVRFGFDADRSGLAPDDRYEAIDARYAALAAEWTRLIRARRGEPAPAAAEGACCPCTGEVCDPGCPCGECPKSEAETSDDGE